MIRLKSAVLLFAVATAFASPSASAFYAHNPNVVVTDQTGMAQQNVWKYSYILDNQSTCFGSCSGTVTGLSIKDYLIAVREFAIPYFTDAGIVDIASPDGWTFAILADDTFNLGFGAGTLLWTATTVQSGIAMGANLGGFSYRTAFAPGKGPFSAGFGNGNSFIGDPAVPLSPNAVAAGIVPMADPAQVPEPQSIMLMLAGLGLLAATRAVRRAK